MGNSMPVHVRNAGQVYRAGERLPSRDPLMEQLAYLMDGIIPIGPWTIGIDPLLGLLPGVGDLIGAAISMAIVFRAVQAGIPRIAVARMMANIAFDTLIGAIPVVGDAFDFAYKSNLKNLRIYDEAVFNRRAAEVRHWGFFAVLLLIALAVLAAATVGVVSILRHWSLV